MSGWLVPIVLYVFGFCVFRFLGGLSSAADAFRQWGKVSSRIRTSFGSS